MADNRQKTISINTEMSDTLKIAYIQPDDIIRNSDGSVTYCYRTKKAADIQADLINLILKNSSNKSKVKVDKKNNEKIKYRITIDKSQAAKLDDIKYHDRLIKVIRFDFKTYYHDFLNGIIPSPSGEKQTKLRTSEHKSYTVYGHGYFHRQQKISPYQSLDRDELKNAKNERSQHQSCTLITKDAQTDVFGSKTKRKNKLVGVMTDPNDAYINRMFFYDAASVKRPYEFDTERQAIDYYNKYVNTAQPRYFSDIDKFKQAIAKKSNYNEVLARIKWNTESSSIGIFCNNFESRCIAQYYAEQLLLKLRAQYDDLNLKLDTNYQVPIIYYLPNDRHNFTAYDNDAQQNDITKAQTIFNDETARLKSITSGNAEYLLILPDPKKIWLSLIDDKHNPIRELVETGQFQILDGIFRRAYPDNLRRFPEVITELLMNSNIKIKIKPLADNSTILHYVADRGMPFLMKIILKKARASDINVKDQYHYTPLHIAAKYGNIDFIITVFEGHKFSSSILINDQGNKIRRTPLHEATVNGHLDAVILLMKYGSDIKLKDANGDTLLHLAVSNDQTKIVNQLSKINDKSIEHCINHKNNEGNTPIHLAVINNNHLILEALQNIKVIQFNKTNHDGMTALHLAVQNNNRDAVNILLKSMTDISSKDNTGSTALDIANQNGYTDIANILSNYQSKNYRNK